MVKQFCGRPRVSTPSLSFKTVLTVESSAPALLRSVSKERHLKQGFFIRTLCN
jgi:hypothetical protein